MRRAAAGTATVQVTEVRQTASLRVVTCLLCVLVNTLAAQQALADQASALSRWLSRDAAPEIGELLSRHPRYSGQQVVPEHPDNALEQAVITVLQNRLAKAQGIVLPQSGGTGADATPPVSIDALDCRSGPAGDYRLRVTADGDTGGRDQLRLDLVEAGVEGQIAHSWQWSGSFSRAERSHLRKTASPREPDGSLAAPWSGDDVDAASRALSRDLACALRPQLASRLHLEWPSHSGVPPLIADTANATRHLLGSYRGINTSGEQSDLQIELRLERFRDDIWQLWLVGTPRRQDLAPVQAVTYFRQAGMAGPPQQLPVAAPETRPAYTGDPLEYLEVQLLDATQADLAGSRADLEVTLRIANRGKWPIAYAFTLSGGHFNHCIADPAYYRHDRYGRLSGRLAAGGSVVRHLSVERARHRPAPLFGVRKCAGFRDLDGFEEFASRGYKVTDFVRWDM